MVIKPPPPQNRRKKGGKAETVSQPTPAVATQTTQSSVENTAESVNTDNSPVVATPSNTPTEDSIATPNPENLSPSPLQLTVEDVTEKVSAAPYTGLDLGAQTEQIYCPECYLPLHPDPKPEKLYIFLHALKYTISLGEFSTEMPDWAAEGFEWDQT